MTVPSMFPPLTSTLGDTKVAAVRFPVTSPDAKVTAPLAAVSRLVILNDVAVTAVNSPMDADRVPISVPAMLPPEMVAVPTVSEPSSAVRIPVTLRDVAVILPETSSEVDLICPDTSSSELGDAVPIPTRADPAVLVSTTRCVVFTVRSPDTVAIVKVPKLVRLG